jgi:hypothetical protein
MGLGSSMKLEILKEKDLPEKIVRVKVHKTPVKKIKKKKEVKIIEKEMVNNFFED